MTIYMLETRIIVGSGVTTLARQSAIYRLHLPPVVQLA